MKIERVNHSFTEQITQTHSPRRVFKPYLFTPTFCKSRTHKPETIVGVKFNFCIFLCHNRLISIISVFNSYDVIHKANYQVVNDKDIFTSKLRDAHYSYNPKYDEYEYDLRAIDEYCVTAEFPRITRAGIPSAIAKASFDLTISEIFPHKKLH